MKRIVSFTAVGLSGVAMVVVVIAGLGSSSGCGPTPVQSTASPTPTITPTPTLPPAVSTTGPVTIQGLHYTGTGGHTGFEIDRDHLPPGSFVNVEFHGNVTVLTGQPADLIFYVCAQGTIDPKAQCTIPDAGTNAFQWNRQTQWPRHVDFTAARISAPSSGVLKAYILVWQSEEDGQRVADTFFSPDSFWTITPAY